MSYKNSESKSEELNKKEIAIFYISVGVIVISLALFTYMLYSIYVYQL